MLSALGRSSVVTNHCLWLVSTALLLNLLLGQSLKPNNYTLTAFLVFNYVSLALVSLEAKRWPNGWLLLSVVSLLFALISRYLLSLDCTLCLTIWSLVSNIVYVNVFSGLSSSLRSSFSLAEVLVVSQLCVSYVSTGAACLVSRWLRSSKANLFCCSATSDLVIQILFVGIASIGILQVVLSRQTNIRSKTINIVTLVVPIIATYYFLSVLLTTNPITWLLDFLFIDANRTDLMIMWIVILSVTLLFTVLFVTTARTNASTATRKFFHLGISLVYLTGLKRDVTLLTFCSAALLAVLVVLEVIRVRRLPPFAALIEQTYCKFRSEQDIGLLTLTHIYLLVGTSLPLWLTSSFTSANLLAMSSGIITVGVGDTAAAVGGSLFGRHRWKGSKKTYEGTACAFLAQICATLMIVNYSTPDIVLSVSNIVSLTAICLTTAVIEAKLTDIDNLILPIYHYVLVKLVFK